MVNYLQVKTKEKTEFIDITKQIDEIVKICNVKDGICTIFIPHTTAAITVNENADPDVKDDLIKVINKIIPFDDDYKHVEGNSAAHIKASLIGPSETLIIENGNLILGTWQGIYFCEFDGPRTRSVIVKIMESK